ncbi:MAG: DUF5686 family protein [Microscillaceae bacterium]
MTQLEGQVLDAQTQQSLPFVHVIINEGEAGTVSDIDGRFALKVGVAIQKVRFSYIGYTPFVYEVRHPDDLWPLQRFLTIRLSPANQTLREVVVSSGENPAHRLIQLAARNRRRHNPENRSSFLYQAYHKFHVQLGASPVADSVLAQASDSSDLETLLFLKDHHLFLSESVTEHRYRAPWHRKTVVLGNRISGFQDPQFFTVASAFEPFIFYKDFINLFQKSYLNPISPGSITQYDFQIEDTLLVQSDSIYIIAFSPLPNKNFEGLEGRLAIHTKGYALQYISAQSLDPHALIHFRIEQKFELFEDRQWFPAQMHADLHFKQLSIAQQAMQGVFRSYVQQINLEPALKAADFDEVTQEITPEAARKPEAFWQARRPVGLSPIEQNTYQYLDSAGRAAKVDRVLKVAQALATQRWSWGKVDVDLRHLLRINRFEGLRLGLGLLTNADFHENWQLGGYVAYGFKDGRIKYGAQAAYLLPGRYGLRAGLSYSDDVWEPGNVQLWSGPQSLLTRPIRYFLTERMDRLRKGMAWVEGRPLRFTQVQLGLSTTRLDPLYDYTFFDEEADRLRQSFHLTEFSARLRFAFGEEYGQIGQYKIWLGAKSPYFLFHYARGLDWLGGEYAYQKWESLLTYTFQWRKIGQTQATVSGGWVSGKVPYPLLYHSPGLTRDMPVHEPNHFQTMELYEFLSNRFVHVFLLHRFGELLFKSKSRIFRPALTLAHSMGWGDLSNPSRHQQIDFKIPRRGFYESGLLLEDLLRFKYLDTAYLGLGAGVFFRYGPYQLDTFAKNTFYRLTSRFTF